MVLKKSSKNIVRSFAVFTLAFSGTSYCSAQMHTPFLSHYQWLNNAEQQYVQEIFSVAAFSAKQHINQSSAYFLNTDPVIQKDKAEFILNLSVLKTGGGKVDYTTANPAFRERYAFAAAHYYFRQGNWAEAITEYRKANIENLSNAEIVQSKFELAYCYFNNKQFEEAKALFVAIKDIDGGNSPSANYYYGLLAYNEGSYDEAINSFEKIEQLPQYQNVVPYYIAEIAYFKGDRAKALQKAKTEIDKSPKSFYDNEFHLLAAQCLFEEEKYNEALPYFEHYYDHVDKIHKQDVYKMAYSYYRTAQWQKAIEPFKQLSTVQDELGQTAMYYLGDCYLKTKDKTGAKNAFSLCSEMSYNRAVIEPSLLISGKLAFELGYSAEGSGQLKKLINEFPASPYKAEAINILSEQLLKSRNYTEAHQLLRTIESPSRVLVQKAAYGLALQNMQQNNREEAKQLLEQSLQNNEDADYEAAAYFWKAELEYANKNYATALADGKNFLAKNSNGVSAISPNANQQNALMTLGYAALNLQDYGQSRSYFAQAQNKQSTKNYSGKQASEAALREADAAFLQKDYAKATELYTKSISQNGSDADYARFQKSTLLGLQGRSGEQAEILLEIIAQKNPESKYKYEAHYALGDLHLEANKYEDAINHFQKITDFTAKHLAAKALMKTAFAYQEADNDEKAIEIYKKVVANYPNSDQRNGALEALKDLYVSTNQPNAYVQLLKENNLSGTDNAGLDSLFYSAAETQFSSGKYAKATEAMRNYLKQYPQGIFKTKANFYKAESHYQLRQYDSALLGYDAVLNEAWSDFTEPSALKAAALAYAQSNFAAAEKYYGILRNNAIGKDNLKTAYKGLMLASKNLNRYEQSLGYADTLLLLPELDEQSKHEAMLIKGNAAMKASKYDEANSYYAQLSTSKNIEIAAESIFRQAEILFAENKITEAETAANKAIQQTTGSNYWNTKSYLLMADIFIAQKDYFNAKATLQSIVKNVKNETLKKEAGAKLEQVKVLEKGKSKLREG